MNPGALLGEMEEQEEEEEGGVSLHNILDLLLAGGYFRSRISSLSPFDKLTGGLAWCITASNEDVDFDMFYDDDATLGEKIKAGEKIECALQRMGCPHPLQAHQIQGLDYYAVYPVVQWLVQRVLATREALGDQLRRYSHLRFQENYKLPDEESLQRRRLERHGNVGQTLSKLRSRRLYRRAKNTVLPLTRIDRLRCTLLEYGHVFARPIALADGDEPPFFSSSLSATTSDTAEQPASLGDSGYTNVEESFLALPASTDGILLSSKLEHIVSLCTEEIHAAALQYSQTAEVTMTHKKQVESLLKQIDFHGRRNLELTGQIRVAKLVLEELDQNRKEQEEKKVRLQAELDGLWERSEMEGVGDIVLRLCSLLEELKVLEKKELSFQESCNGKCMEMQGLIQQLEGQASNYIESDNYETNVDNAIIADTEKLTSLQKDLAKTNQKVSLLRRKLDEIPAQAELMQYERCFVELYLHIQAKLRETRKYYATYNALAEANELTVKEISLLNSINTQFESAMSTAEGRAKFVDSLRNIVLGVKKKLEKMGSRHQIEQKKLSNLKEKHVAAIAAQRNYANLMKTFQDECARNEKLHAELGRPLGTETN